MGTPQIVATEHWQTDHPGSRAAAVTYRGLVLASTPELDRLKRDLEAELRARWGEATKAEISSEPTLAAYERHDKRFGQNYHVAMQIRSIAQKGKTIPDRSPAIEAMFMTELKTGVLAAAQDADQIIFPITVDSATGDETYTRYDGVEERCKAGDQLMRDGSGAVLTSIAQGPTAYGLVGEGTTAVTYCFYFPDGVTDDVIAQSFAYLDTCVRAFSP
ncbi:MAG: hypothetical protein M3Y37_00500, partial [Chloroflexota bacterium]|nr:hypothetical protein [Chloroflexota bacterium]